MSVVAPDLVEHLKSQTKGLDKKTYPEAITTLLSALERAIGALEQIDHNTKLRPHD